MDNAKSFACIYIYRNVNVFNTELLVESNVYPIRHKSIIIFLIYNRQFPFYWSDSICFSVVPKEILCMPYIDYQV